MLKDVNGANWKVYGNVEWAGKIIPFWIAVNNFASVIKKKRDKITNYMVSLQN